jgi:hypothetical protein
MATQTRPFNCFDAGGAVLFALQKKAVDPGVDLQLTAAIEQRIRNRELVDSSVRVAKLGERSPQSEAVAGLGGSEPWGPAPAINQPTTESEPTPPSTPTQAPTAAPSTSRKGPSLATVLIGYPVLAMTMVVVFGIPLLALSNVVTSAIQRSRPLLAPAAVKPIPATPAPATPERVKATSVPVVVPPVPAKAQAVATVDATQDPEPPVLPPPAARQPIVVPVEIPAAPPPPTVAELRAPHPSPGQIAEQESIERLEALGVICSPARSRFLSAR